MNEFDSPLLADSAPAKQKQRVTELNPCAPRKRFKTKESCFSACAKIATTNAIQRYVIGCEKCNGWHLS